MDPEKDADGLHPMNLGRLVANVSGPMKSPLPCTPKGCVELLTRHGIDLNGKRVLVVGRGVTIGRPVGLLLTRKDVNATVILAHTGTVDLPAELRQADVVIAAAGQPHMIKAGGPQARARSCSTSASAASMTAPARQWSPETWTPPRPTSPPGSRRTPGEWAR